MKEVADGQEIVVVVPESRRDESTSAKRQG
jgi:hypothetical protein